MKVLYGVQGTGNGHITRARGMVKHLAEAGIDADFIFTGRPLDKFNDMEPFGDWRHLEGLTFAVSHGRIQMLDTLRQARPGQFLRDIKTLSLVDYDLVITDFEPVTAWAAKRQHKPCLGIGHQYAFDYPIPKTGDNPVTRGIMRHFAPTQFSIGMHWHHFNQPIIPPIVDVVETSLPTEVDKIIVYLPFEAVSDVLPLLQPLTDFQFLYYGHFDQEQVDKNVVMKPISRLGFQQDLARCNGVISNAGFELASESIGLGKRILAKPLHGQMEQLSNGLALEQLGLGRSVKQLSTAIIADWLEHCPAHQVIYPNTAKYLCEWIAQGDWSNKQPLIENLWRQTRAPGLANFTAYPSGTSGQPVTAK